MQYDLMTILTGIFVLFILSYALIVLFNLAYLRLLQKEYKIKTSKTLLATAVVSLAWIVSTFVAIWIAGSYGVLIFSIFSLILIFGTSYLFSEKLLGVSGKSKILYCALLSVIFNPGWLVLLKIL